MSEFTIDVQEYHSGDGVVEGWPPKVGRAWSKNFDFPQDPGEAMLIIDVQETQAEHNEVFINNVNVGHLLRNPKRAYVPSTHRVPQGVLRKGTNTLYVRVGLVEVHPQENYDDILIRNIRLVF